MSTPPEGGLLNPITAVRVRGFKSLVDEQTIAIRPLTLLAGANSSGKSSAMQPLLLLKQTLESSYDPGPLLLDGPHVRFTSADQVLSNVSGRTSREFEAVIELENQSLGSVFQRGQDGNLELDRTVLALKGAQAVLKVGMSQEEAEELSKLTWDPQVLSTLFAEGFSYSVVRERCFLDIAISKGEASLLMLGMMLPKARILRILHVPALRGNPERVYKATGGARRFFPGTFENYTAGIIALWQEYADDRVEALSQALEHLGLSWTVRARSIDVTQVELLLGRLPQKPTGRSEDFVNVADMGFGVSQILPALVALLLAEPNQMVYLEQPELHLHPRAQEALALVLVDAANRGVQVVAETHSSLLLLAIQTLVVEGKISPDRVKLHWFQRDSRGATQVHSADMDRLGTYGDWPEDFGRVRLEADNRYLDAVEARAFSPKKRAKK